MRNNKPTEEVQNYAYIHYWLTKNFGRANHCENPECAGKSSRFEWAKLKDKTYARYRENFWQLCKQCHTEYDDNNRGGWNRGQSLRYKSCELCSVEFHYMKKSRRFCSNSCSSKYKAANGVMQKAWTTRRLKLQEAK